jgi:hypothetical protein
MISTHRITTNFLLPDELFEKDNGILTNSMVRVYVGVHSRENQFRGCVGISDEVSGRDNGVE